MYDLSTSMLDTVYKQNFEQDVPGEQINEQFRLGFKNGLRNKATHVAEVSPVLIKQLYHNLQSVWDAKGVSGRSKVVKSLFSSYWTMELLEIGR